jgi:hypothetical protein
MSVEISRFEATAKWFAWAFKIRRCWHGHWRLASISRVQGVNKKRLQDVFKCRGRQSAPKFERSVSLAKKSLRERLAWRGMDRVLGVVQNCAFV